MKHCTMTSKSFTTVTGFFPAGNPSVACVSQFQVSKLNRRDGEEGGLIRLLVLGGGQKILKVVAVWLVHPDRKCSSVGLE